MKKNGKNENSVSITQYKIVFLIALALALVFASLLLIIRNNQDYTKTNLNKNDKTIFSITDLTINDLKYTDDQKTIEKKLGKAQKEKEYKKDIYTYKKMYYDGLVLTLRENYADYMLVGVKVTSSKYKLSRDIKVNQNITKIIKKYKIDNKEGTYMYGNYSISALKSSEIKSTIYFGVRGKKEVSYVYRDAVIEGTKTNIARMTISYKNGKAKSIEWLYDYE